VPIFKSEEEKLKKKVEKERRQAEKQAEAAKKIEAANQRISERNARYEKEMVELKEDTRISKLQYKAEADREKAVIEANYRPKLDQLDEELAEVKAHNRAVISEWKEEVRGIKRDFLDNQRQITQNNRARARGTSIDSSVSSIEETTNQTSDQSSKFAALKELKELLDTGILTQEEFESEKNKILTS